jgi:type I restriction enzyme, S subunit
MSELPEGWVQCTIGDLCRLNNGRAFKPTEWVTNGLPIVRIQNLNNPDAKFNYFDGDFDERYSLKGGELLFAWSGTPGTSFGAHIWRGGKAVLNQHIFRVDFDSISLDKRFFRYAINQTLDLLIDVAHGGVGLRHVTKGTFEGTTISLPPYAEQKRIAAKLEVLLGRVDGCRERLEAVGGILKRFRQSVLAAATSGRLTEDWREANGGGEEWEKRKLPDLGELGRGKSKHRPRNDVRLYGGPYPFIQTGDIANSGGLIDKHSQTYSEFGFSQSKLWPAQTVCITIAANIADTAILSYPACFPDSVVGFIANPAECYPKFIKWSIDVISEALESFAPATAQKNINLGILYDIDIALPPLPEQQEIVRRVETLFALADRLEARLGEVRKVVERLTPALLAKAFRGELVAQDPTDEPASALLERLRASGVDGTKGRRKKADR